MDNSLTMGPYCNSQERSAEKGQQMRKDCPPANEGDKGQDDTSETSYPGAQLPAQEQRDRLQVKAKGKCSSEQLMLVKPHGAAKCLSYAALCSFIPAGTDAFVGHT